MNTPPLAIKAIHITEHPKPKAFFFPVPTGIHMGNPSIRIERMAFIEQLPPLNSIPAISTFHQALFP